MFDTRMMQHLWFELGGLGVSAGHLAVASISNIANVTKYLQIDVGRDRCRKFTIHEFKTYRDSQRRYDGCLRGKRVD